MEGFWRSRKAYYRVLQLLHEIAALESQDAMMAIKEAIKAITRETRCGDFLKQTRDRYVQRAHQTTVMGANSGNGARESQRPVVFASACVSAKESGCWKYCGGVKELNYLVKTLRSHGYEAYFVTYDGAYEPWLIEHQPHVSLREFVRIKETGRDIRCVTSLASAHAFLGKCDSVYFWDMELCMTANNHYHLLAELYLSGKLVRSAAISRTIQAWHMANFGRTPVIIPNLIDETVWSRMDDERIVHRVGYMNEGSHTRAYIQTIEDKLKSNSVQYEMVMLKGDEREILSQMRTCDVFLSMNAGKDPLWGEGCPRTVLEALSVGAVVVGFDIIGNREVLIDNLNGRIVERDNPEEMAAALLDLLKYKAHLEDLRTSGAQVNERCHKLESRWGAIRHYLDL